MPHVDRRGVFPTRWIQTLAFLGAHGGGTIREADTSYPADATFDAWVTRATGRQLAELCDLLAAAGHLDRATVLAVVGLPTPVTGGVLAAVETRIECEFRGHGCDAGWRVQFDALDRAEGDRLRARLGEELRAAWDAADAQRRARAADGSVDESHAVERNGVPPT